MVGGLFGLLCLTRASYVILAPVVPVLLALYYRWTEQDLAAIARSLAVFAIGWMAMVGPWLAPQCGVRRTLGTYGRIWIRNPNRTVRLQRHERARIPALRSHTACLQVGPPLIEQRSGRPLWSASSTLRLTAFFMSDDFGGTSWSRRMAGWIR